MAPDQLKKVFGEEYPAAVVVNGHRIPLSRERRFSRSYHSAEHKTGTEVSRFMDGSASITFAQFKAEWPAWSEDERLDFCNASVWLHEQADFPSMLRFLIEHGSPEDLSTVALSIASRLPQDEAFRVLLANLKSAELGKSSNFAQALAVTKHPSAETTLRQHLETLWVRESIWEDDEFLNWVAYDAMTCIRNLIDLGASTSDFENQVRQLSQHRCNGNRLSCVRHLSKHYPWLV